MSNLRGADYTRAVEHARREVERSVRIAKECPAYKGQVKSCLIALAALEVLQDYHHEQLALNRAQAAREQPKGECA